MRSAGGTGGFRLTFYKGPEGALVDKCLALRHIKPWSPQALTNFHITASLGKRLSYKLSLEILCPKTLQPLREDTTDSQANK